MEPKSVRVHFDLYCSWEGLPPSYRIYVADELFSERTFRWTDSYLEEMLPVRAMPGNYEIRLEPLKPNLAKFEIKNIRIEYGPGEINGNMIRILDESQ